MDFHGKVFLLIYVLIVVILIPLKYISPIPNLFNFNLLNGLTFNVLVLSFHVRSGTMDLWYFPVQIKNPFVQLDLCLVTALCIFHRDVHTRRTQPTDSLCYAPSAL